MTRHFNLSARLQKAKKIARTCGEVQHCYRDELLQEILNKRVPHLADKFWEKQHEAAQNGQLFSFDNLVNMIETWDEEKLKRTKLFIRKFCNFG